MIQLQNLVKDYGNLRAVDHINFEINEGEILGFLGPNGAGKSTTLKMITCFLTPTAGNITVEDRNVYDNSKEIREMIGYLPETNPLYTDMTVYDYLKFVADIRKISNFKQRLKEVTDKCGLHGVVSKPIGTLSKGYRQRVGLAQAIIHDPKILILDEPTTGLDPNQIVEIRQLIKELGKEKTLIMSSHILQEVQAVCDRIVIINKGKIVADGSTQQLQNNFQNKNKLVLEIMATKDELGSLADAVEGVELLSLEPVTAHINKAVLEYSVEQDKRKEIYEFIKQQEWVLLEMKRESMSLEAVFRNLTIEEGGQA
ncbi:MAG TPA: multidrug ABC transporter ATP-binding protein [Candidatus Cloacimonas sp.]|jgi:ABC-2 type transport system ATP-binding protein|nr:gliding motility-associated transport system ATP-binding protein [Candidatus Cloacimonadota bacterium]HCX73520.1 multidrug ABC transporter ATP-binding protein [Candidatus Cloacimonas sp.]